MKPIVFMNTDIIGALKIAEDLLDSKRKNIIVIFSDMLNDTPDELNFDKIKLDSVKIKEIIEKIKKHGNLPKFGNVKIYVIGIRAINSEKLAEIRNFWSEYFKATGAVIENYEPSLNKEIRKG
jgi:choline kinase